MFINSCKYMSNTYHISYTNQIPTKEFEITESPLDARGTIINVSLLRI